MLIACLALPLCFAVSGIVPQDDGQTLNRSTHIDYTARYRPLMASAEAKELVRTLLYAGQLDKAEAVLTVQLKQHPGDFDLRHIAFKVAFLQGKYALLEPLTQLPPSIVDEYPELRRALNGWIIEGGLAAANYSGLAIKADKDKLEQAVLKVAEENAASLPFEMVTEDGIHTKPEILVLTLLMRNYERNARFLLDRIVKLAPNDTFVLELQANDYTRQQKHAKAVEFLKKSIKAKPSKERKKKLQGLLVEAEKKAAYQKVIGEVQDKKGGGE